MKSDVRKRVTSAFEKEKGDSAAIATRVFDELRHNAKEKDKDRISQLKDSIKAYAVHIAKSMVDVSKKSSSSSSKSSSSSSSSRSRRHDSDEEDRRRR
jgi:hypothetical protein